MCRSKAAPPGLPVRIPRSGPGNWCKAVGGCQKRPWPSWRHGDLLLVPPVVILLQHLAATADFESFAYEISATTAAYRDGAMH